MKRIPTLTTGQSITGLFWFFSCVFAVTWCVPRRPPYDSSLNHFVWPHFCKVIFYGWNKSSFKGWRRVHPAPCCMRFHWETCKASPERSPCSQNEMYTCKSRNKIKVLLKSLGAVFGHGSRPSLWLLRGPWSSQHQRQNTSTFFMFSPPKICQNLFKWFEFTQFRSFFLCRRFT